MGAVYRATDTKLNREVAIKVLPEALANDPDYLAQFVREAQVLASLNHPHIAILHSVEERALVMELVQGQTLEELIAAGPIQIEEALGIALQIAEALDAAHEKGVDSSRSETRQHQGHAGGRCEGSGFRAGESHGSGVPGFERKFSHADAAGDTGGGDYGHCRLYGSGRRRSGKAVDRRADIWSFGVVLHELLDGQAALYRRDHVPHSGFGAQGPDRCGHSAGASADPAAVGAVPEPRSEGAIARYRRSADCDSGLSGESRGGGGAVPIGESGQRQGPGQRGGLDGCGGSVGGFCGMGGVEVQAVTAGLHHALCDQAGEGQTFTNYSRPVLAISPDGKQVVYVANRRLYLRPLDEWEGRPIPGTESEIAVGNPLFSPDGKWLAFFDASSGNLKRIPLSGGSATTICAAGTVSRVGNPLGASWSDGRIVFSVEGEGIMGVAENGGQPQLLVAAKADETLAYPQLLPGGEAVLFSVSRGDTLASDRGSRWQIAVQTLKSGIRKVVAPDGNSGRYLPTGHLVYVANGILFAVPFNVPRLEASGSAMGMVEGVSQTGFTAHFACSNSGSLIYIPGGANPSGSAQNLLAIADRKGAVETLKAAPGAYEFPRASKDGKRIVYQIDDGKESSIWIYALSGETAPRRLTLPGTRMNRYPIWSADQQRVAFQSDREGDAAIWWQRADGDGAAERLTRAGKDFADIPDSWSPDGQTMSYTEEKHNASSIWTYSLRDRKSTLLAGDPGAALGRSVFSPDGRWVAYQAVALPRSRIYIRPFPAAATTYILPEDRDSHHPVWSPDGRELFYVAGPNQTGSVTVSTQPNVNFGSPVPSDRSGFATQIPAAIRTYDMLPDGKHLIGVVPARLGASGDQQIQVVMNWFEDLKQRASR